MKIVHVVYSMEMGGAESLVAQLCRLQRAEGHEVTVLAQAKLGTLGERMRGDGFGVEVVGTGHPLRRFPRWLKLFRALRPDVVHCHNPAPTIQAAPAARLAGAKTIVSTRHSLVAPPYDLAAERTYGLAAWCCDWIVGICEATCVNLRGAPLARGSRIVRVYNGTAALPASADRERLREEARGLEGPADRAAGGPPAEPTIFLFVGRLAPIKDLATMVQAFASAGAAERADLRLWIVGDGPERKRLEAMVDDLGLRRAVRFWGETHEVAAFFQAADVFTMASVSEGLPMSLLQAMSVGLPSLVTDVGGMAEVVRLAEGGMTVPVGDSAAMATAMLRLAGDRDLRLRLGENARRAHGDRFTLERMSEGYMALYRDRIEGHRSRGSGRTQTLEMFS